MTGGGRFYCDISVTVYGADSRRSWEHATSSKYCTGTVGSDFEYGMQSEQHQMFVSKMLISTSVAGQAVGCWRLVC